MINMLRTLVDRQYIRTDGQYKQRDRNPRGKNARGQKLTEMKNALMGFLVNWSWLREDMLRQRIYQQNPQKQQQKQRTKTKEKNRTEYLRQLQKV